jgi:hypothetical protein
MNRTGLLNELAKRYHYTSYLEVGVRAPWLNYDLVEVKHKYGCDPVLLAARPGLVETKSDDYFAQNGTEQFDLVFVDGDHSEEQCWRDICNAVAALEKGGTIVVHDINPLHESHQGAVHRADPVNNPLNLEMGTAWRAWVKARRLWSSTTLVIRDDQDAPSDCGIIQPWNGRLDKANWWYFKTYEAFALNRDHVLSLRDWTEAQGVL